MNQPEQFAHHLRVFKELLQPGKAVLAWHLAYFLARQTPPVPIRDEPITIPMDERPPLVIAALRWISDRAAISPASQEDDDRRQRGWIAYFVRAETAQSMLDEAGQHDDPWRAMPRVRTIDAAVLITGDQPRAGLLHIEQLTPVQSAAAQIVAQQTGAVFLSKWAPRVNEAADWISAEQLHDLLVRFGDHQVLPKTPTKRRSLYESRPALRERVILDAVKQLGLEAQALPPNVRGKRGGVRSLIKQKAMAISSDAFGPGDKDKGFNTSWDAARNVTKTLKYAVTNKPHRPAQK